MTVVAKELPDWMPEKSREDLNKLEAKKVQERFKPTLRDRLASVRYAKANRQTWHIMPFFLMHLLSCAYADVPSLELVKSSSRSNFGPITSLMKKIGSLADLGIELTRACEITRKEARLYYFRDFLQRFAQVSKLGEDIISFLSKEYNTFMIMYTSNMERSLVRFRRFSDAYSAILSSSVLIILIMIFTGMLWGAGLDLVNYALPGIMIVYFVFAYIFYSGSPLLKIVSSGTKTPRLASLIRINGLVTKTTLVAYTVLLALLCAHVIPSDIGILAISLTGLPALITGYLGRRLCKKIEELDERFPDFLTMLATNLSTTGISITFAFRELSKLDFGRLSPYIRHLRAMLDLGLDKEISWGMLQRETSSELVRLHTDAFSTALNYGALARNIGPIISNSSLFVLTMRRRIDETSAMLRGIVLPMHPIMCAIMGLIMAIVTQFVSVFTQYQSADLPIAFISIIPIPLIETYIYILLGALTIVNGFIVHEIGGEQDFTLSYYTGILIVIGWLTYYLSLTAISAYLYNIGLGNISGILEGI